ncbi:MAG: hypothetical protein ABI831_16160 [Betaproteobacteria bacterium]
MRMHFDRADAARLAGRLRTDALQLFLRPDLDNARAALVNPDKLTHTI